MAAQVRQSVAIVFEVELQRFLFLTTSSNFIAGHGGDGVLRKLLSRFHASVQVCVQLCPALVLRALLACEARKRRAQTETRKVSPRAR